MVWAGAMGTDIRTVPVLTTMGLAVGYYSQLQLGHLTDQRDLQARLRTTQAYDQHRCNKCC